MGQEPGRGRASDKRVTIRRCRGLTPLPPRCEFLIDVTEFRPFHPSPRCLMNTPVWPKAFPAGIADPSGQFALVRQSNGRLMAVRLHDGNVVWRQRHDVALQPLLVDSRQAVALSTSHAQVFAFSLHTAAAGAEWVSARLPWPEWATDANAQSVQSDCDAIWLGQDMGLRWELRLLYRGGAKPGPARPMGQTATGTCRVDLRSGGISSLPTWPEGPGLLGWEPSQDPMVVAQCRINDREYRLTTRHEGSTVITSISARDVLTGHVFWEVPLDEVVPRGPPPLRQ